MSVLGPQQMSLRPGRLEYKRLGWALLISLIVHLFCWGGYEFTRRVLPVWLERIKILAALAHKLEIHKPNPPPPQPTQVPLVFVEVNPEVVTAEPPKDAKYYSSQNTKAANPDAQLDTDTPKITGRQEKVAKTEDAPRNFNSLQPAPSPKEDEVAKEDKPAEQAKPKPPVGDLAMAKPTPALRPDTGTAEQTRPRTLLEAKMRQQQNNFMEGQKMKQEGGVRRHRSISSLDAIATPFGEYDKAFIGAVNQRWFDLLDSRQFALDRTGKVVLRFRLNYDGRITDMQVLQTTVGDTLAYVCELAVTDPAPYARWPSDMRREAGDSRLFTWEFDYD